MLISSSGTRRPARPRPAAQPRVPTDFTSRWIRPLRDPRLLVMVGLILAYVWRFHELTTGLRVLRVAAILTVASWVLIAMEPRFPVLAKGVRRPFVACYLMIITWGLISLPMSLDPARSWDFLAGTHFKNITFLVFLLTTITSFRALRFALAANVLGVGVLAFFYIKQGTPQQWTPVDIYDRNDLALLFNMFLPITLWLASIQTGKLRKAGLLLLAGALAFCVLMSQSRGGFLALAIIVLYLMVSLRTVPVRVRVLPLFLLAGGVLVLPQAEKDRLRTLLELEQDYNVESETGRMEIWKRGLGYIAQKPIFGVGVANFSTAEATISDEARNNPRGFRRAVAHNSYLEITAETGLPGGILYFTLVFSALTLLWRAIRRLRPFKHHPGAVTLTNLAILLSGSMVGFAAGSFFLSTFAGSGLVTFLGLLAGFTLVVERSLPHFQAARRPIAFHELG